MHVRRSDPPGPPARDDHSCIPCYSGNTIGVLSDRHGSSV